MASLSMTFKLLGKDVSASKAFKGVGKAADSVGKRVQGMGALAGVSAVAIGAAAIKIGTDSVKAYTEAEGAQTKLQDAYSRFPALASGNIDAIRKLGTERAKVTRFDDDATAAAAAQLAQFGLNQAQLQDMIPLVQDYAAKTGQDLPSASGKVGKALLGNTKALKELGIAYKPTGDKAKDYLAIQKLLTEKVGGFAEKEGKSAAGQAAILGNQFGEVQETIGGALLPALMGLASFAINTLIPAIQSLADWIGQNVDWLLPLAAGIAIIVGAIKVWTIVQAALNIVMALNPIGLVVIAIAALVAALVIAWQKSETFRAIVTGAWEAIKAAAQAVGRWFMGTLWPLLKKVIDFVIGYYKLLWTVFSTVVKWIIEKGAALVGWFTELPGKISTAVTGLWDGLKNSFRGAINWIIGRWNEFRLTLGGQHVDLPFGQSFDVPSVTLDTPNIPMLAKGGIVTRPTLALIGESGPEAVIPLGRGGTGGIHLHFHGPVAGPGAGRWMAEEIAKAQSSGRGARKRA